MAKFILSAFADEADQSLEQQIAALQEEKITLIELRGVDGKSCADLTMEEADSIRRKLDRGGISLSALGSPYGKYPIEAPFSDHFEQFRHGLALCRRLGCQRMRMFSFFVPAETDSAQWADEVFDRLERMLDEADHAGIQLVHENEKGIFGHNIDNCVSLLTRFHDRMGFIFDPANFVQCGVDTRRAYAELHDKITYMHIKDALEKDGAVVSAGRGDGHVAEILRKLDQEREGEIILTVEPHLAVFSGLYHLQEEKIKHHEVYGSQREAFHAACEATRRILTQIRGEQI